MTEAAAYQLKIPFSRSFTFSLDHVLLGLDLLLHAAQGEAGQVRGGWSGSDIVPVILTRMLASFRSAMPAASASAVLSTAALTRQSSAWVTGLVVPSPGHLQGAGELTAGRAWWRRRPPAGKRGAGVERRSPVLLLAAGLRCVSRDCACAIAFQIVKALDGAARRRPLSVPSTLRTRHRCCGRWR